jgi:hypothetical protein
MLPRHRRNNDQQYCAGSEVEIPTAKEPDSTTSEALYNCVNILLGCGILTIPFALKEGGWAALGVLALMGLSTNYTGTGAPCSHSLSHSSSIELSSCFLPKLICTIVDDYYGTSR